MLVFEDLHWADDDLLDFVDELADWIDGVPLLVVATARPELLERRPGWGGGKRNAQTLSLAPLADDDTARLLSALLDRLVLPAEAQQAAARPRRRQPALRGAVRAHVRGARRCLGATFPRPCRESSPARLDSLPPEEKRLLLDAAVLGKTFWVGALESIGGADGGARDRLHALQRKEFVRRERRSSVAGETEFAFTHLLVRDVAYAQIPRAERAEKHLRRGAVDRVARATAPRISPSRSRTTTLAALELTRASGGDTAALVEPAARALLRRGRARRLALRVRPGGAVRREGARARRAGKHRVLRARSSGSPRPSTNLGSGRGRRRAAAAAECVPRARRRRGGGGGGDARIAQRLAQGSRRRRRGGRGPRDGPRPRRAHLAGRRRRFWSTAPGCSCCAASFARLSTLGREGLALAEELGITRLEVAALVNVGTALTGLGTGGIAELERAVELGRGGVAPREVQRAYNNLAEDAFSNGRAREAARLYEEAMAEVERYGIHVGVLWLLPQQAEAALAVGDWELAEERLARYASLIAGAEGHYHESQMFLLQAVMASARGDLSTALACGERSVEHARVVKDAQSLGPALAGYARILVEAGRDREAGVLVDEVLALTDPDGAALYFRWVIDMGWLVHDLGRPEKPSNTPRAPVWNDSAQAIARGDFAEAAELLGRTELALEEAYARLRGGRAARVTGPSHGGADAPDACAGLLPLRRRERLRAPR